MTGPELDLRRRIMAAFAATGRAPVIEDGPLLRRLAEQHVVVLDGAGAIHMAHPFAAHTAGARVDAVGRTWWGNCAWDALGIVAALGLREATVTDHGVRVDVVDGAVGDPAVFHVAVPARDWWADVGFT